MEPLPESPQSTVSDARRAEARIDQSGDQPDRRTRRTQTTAQTEGQGAAHDPRSVLRLRAMAAVDYNPAKRQAHAGPQTPGGVHLLLPGRRTQIGRCRGRSIRFLRGLPRAVAALGGVRAARLALCPRPRPDQEAADIATLATIAGCSEAQLRRLFTDEPPVGADALPGERPASRPFRLDTDEALPF